jgi:hypothetical protein
VDGEEARNHQGAKKLMCQAFDGCLLLVLALGPTHPPIVDRGLPPRFGQWTCPTASHRDGAFAPASLPRATQHTQMNDESSVPGCYTIRLGNPNPDE